VREQQHHRPPAAGAASRFTDQHRAATVQRGESEDRGQLGDGDVPEQIFTDQRRQQEQPAHEE
jgi:hypothetical protein